ncbi:hypothetical protein GR927_29045 [Mycolicibacterium sp. 3033]|nr:hypothetical protein [Mycolicibacterium aurantiacum]
MGRGLLILLAAGMLLLPSCARSSDGTPTAVSAESGTSTTTSEAPVTAAIDDAPGVVPTPASSPDEDCTPAGVPTDVRIDDPKAPTVVVGVPVGWTAAPSSDGATLTGSAAMSGSVTIAATPLDAAAAFRGYADDLTADAELSTLSLLPAQTCGFSGQKLMGQLDDVVYQARLVHVPGYLVAVYVEAPTGSPDFDAAASVLTDGLQIGLP